MESIFINNNPNLCTDIDYFKQDDTCKYYFRLKVMPCHLSNAFLQSLTEWEIQPLNVTPQFDDYVSFGLHDLGDALLNLRNFAHDHNCRFIGAHYQYPTNRVIFLDITEDGHKQTYRNCKQASPTNRKAFKHLVEKVFCLTISDNALARISHEDYPDEKMFKLLAKDSIIFIYNEKHLCYKPKSKSKKQHDDSRRII